LREIASVDLAEQEPLNFEVFELLLEPSNRIGNVPDPVVIHFDLARSGGHIRYYVVFDLEEHLELAFEFQLVGKLVIDVFLLEIYGSLEEVGFEHLVQVCLVV